MGTYRVKSAHGQDLHDGAMVAPDELVEVDEKQEHNRRLIEEGVLVHPDDDELEEEHDDEPDEDEAHEPATGEEV